MPLSLVREADDSVSRVSLHDAADGPGLKLLGATGCDYQVGLILRHHDTETNSEIEGVPEVPFRNAACALEPVE